MNHKQHSPLHILFLIICALALLSCGKKEEAQAFRNFRVAHEIASKASAGSFSGNWNVTLKAKKDGCSLGVKTLPVEVAIIQKGSKATVTIKGLKSYKGTINNGILSGGGKNVSDGTTFSGTISAKLSGTNKLKILSATLKVKNNSTNCSILFSGGGTRA